MKNRNLIFICSEFPYGTAETFVENEFPFLFQSFDKIIIITNSTPTGNVRILGSENVEIIYFPYELSFFEKLISFQGVFSKEFWREIRIVFNQYKLSLNFLILKTLLKSMQEGRRLADFLEKTLANKKLNSRETLFYSYWLNDMAIGLAELKTRMPEIRAVSRAHGWDVYMERQASQYLPLRIFLLKNLDVCFPISENGKQYLQSLCKEHRNKIKTSRLGTMNSNPIVLEQKNNTLDTFYTIVSCSNLIPLKRVHLIIEALSMINDTNIKWIHFGSGYLESEIKQLANGKLSALKNIQFEFKGWVSNKELMNFYNFYKIHLFINVSKFEGIPVSIMEAMSFGIPCLATDVGGTSEIVNHRNGVLLTSNTDANEIANAILEFINMNEEMYSDFSKNAFYTWKNDYNAEKNYKAFIGQILEL